MALFRAHLEKGNKDDQRAGTTLLQRQAERAGIVPPGEEKAPETHQCGILVAKGGL